MTIVAVGALSLVGCASNSEDTGTPTGSVSGTASKQNELANLVPDKIKKAGKLVIGVNVPYVPNEYKENGKIIGMDVDILDATAKVLGLKTEYRESDFSKIIPAVEAGTFDVGMSSFTDTKEREKTVDFVDYLTVPIQWAAPKGKTVDPKNACGLRVSVQSTTTESDEELPAKSKACVAAGKKPLDIKKFESQDDATNALMLGNVDAMSADLPITAYAIKKSEGKLVLAGDPISPAPPYGWALAKNSQLTQALQKALQSIIDSGLYGEILKRWSVEKGAVKSATINGAIS